MYSNYENYPSDEEGAISEILFGEETAVKHIQMANEYPGFVNFTKYEIALSSVDCQFCDCAEAFYRIYNESSTIICCNTCVCAFRSDIGWT